jgi:outer membrane protein TolC
MTKINNGCAAAAYFLLVALQGCVTYTPAPLVAAKLRPPDAETIRLQAKAIHHPILQALDFDIDDGLSPDEAAILAVIANPKLRASRDQRKIVAAQLLQAGILPNPQLSYGLDVPTAGTTQGTVNGFNVGLNWEITSLISHNAKLASAKADVVAVDLDLAWQEWQSAQAAKMQVYHLYYFAQELSIARREVEDLRVREKFGNRYS